MCQALLLALGKDSRTKRPGIVEQLSKEGRKGNKVSYFINVSSLQHHLSSCEEWLGLI